MTSTSALKLLVLSWNADGLRLCDTASQAVADNLREKAKGKFFQSQPATCVSPNFFEAVRSKIVATTPHIIVISTQSESNRSLFHNTFLPNTLSGLGYVPSKKEKVKDSPVPVEISGTSNAPPKSLSDTSVSTYLSVYVMAAMAAEFSYEDKVVEKYFSGLPSTQTCSSSQVAVACYLESKQVGRLLFIATHLASTFDKSVVEASNEASKRAIFRNTSSTCSIKMLHTFVDNLQITGNLDTSSILGILVTIL